MLYEVITEKIRPIYKIIDYVPHKGKEARLKFKPDFVELSDVEHDVETWAQNQLKEIERLKDMERYRKDFVGNVSHELKTPIFNIQGYVLTLLEGGLDDPNVITSYSIHYTKLYDHRIPSLRHRRKFRKHGSNWRRKSPPNWMQTRL